MLNWLATSPLASAAKVFVAIVLAFAVADFARTGSIDFTNWQTWVIAGLGAAVPVIVNWLNPADTRYGKVEE
jgi:hypothetical protein